VYSAWPVVMATELVPVDVISTCAPLLTVVITVTNSWSEVETSGVVLTMAVVRGAEETAALDGDGAAFALLRAGAGVGEAPRLVPGAGAGVEAAGALEETGSGSGDDSAGVGEGDGVAEGCRDEGAGAGVDEAGAGVGELPVPEACCLFPWCMYSATPSMWRPSPRLKADDSATSAYRVSSHELRIILCVCVCDNLVYEGGRERMSCAVSRSVGLVWRLTRVSRRAFSGFIKMAYIECVKSR